MTCVLGKNSITCYRGGQKPPKGRVRDRQGNEWFVSIDKDQFSRTPQVEVFKGEVRKRFMKEFLTWIDE